MRMWMLPPGWLCRQHLLGEHNELHMLAGSIQRQKTLEGFISRGLLEPPALAGRHEALVAEMTARGYTHKSPLPDCTAELALYPGHIRSATVDVERSRRDLAERCPDCAARMAAAE